MIYVTGDMHGRIDLDKFYMRCFPEQKGLTKDDLVIICGDFGGIWTNEMENQRIIRLLEARRFSILFCDGNHENFERLYAYPVIDKFGGKVHQISKSIFHAIRGELYSIEGKTFFVMGGASSHDRPHIQGLGWWEEELPSIRELEHGRESLERVNWSVDYVITHCAPSSIQQTEISPFYLTDSLTKYLDEIKTKLVFRKWYFGHYHIHETMQDNRFQALYRKIIPLEE